MLYVRSQCLIDKQCSPTTNGCIRACKRHQLKSFKDNIQIFILDGGFKTTLESPPFNITFSTEPPYGPRTCVPAALQSAHRAFYDAAVDILLTATYQSSIEGFARTDASHTVNGAKRYKRSAIPLVRSVMSPAAERQPSCRVVLSLGPDGATISPIAVEYTGLYPARMDQKDVQRE